MAGSIVTVWDACLKAAKKLNSTATTDPDRRRRLLADYTACAARVRQLPLPLPRAAAKDLVLQYKVCVAAGLVRVPETNLHDSSAASNLSVKAWSHRMLLVRCCRCLSGWLLL